MDPAAAAQRWARVWARAWRTKDAGLLADLYVDGAVFRSHPFRDPQPPLDYARWAFADEEGEPEVWFAAPLVSGDRAVVEWWAVVVEHGGPVSLAGCSLLRFDQTGHVLDQHDYWGSAPGRVAPWSGWAD